MYGDTESGDWDIFGPERPIVVLGSAALDAKVKASTDLSPEGSVPGSIRLAVGGVARNIAESLARFELPTILITAVGDDSVGDYILSNTDRAGVDVSRALRIPAEHTGAYLAMLLKDGSRAWSLDDMAVMSHLTPDVIYENIDVIQGARTVVLDNNLPLESLETVIHICNESGVSICADPTSRFLAPRFKPFFNRFNLMTPNQREAEVLTDATIQSVDDALIAARKLVRKGLKMAMITMGDMGVVYATANERGHVAAPSVDVTDLTGGSDAMTAAVVYALVNDIPVGEAVRLGVTAAMLTITSTDTVRRDLSLELLYDSMVA
jgi:pseudouridine kinase